MNLFTIVPPTSCRSLLTWIVALAATFSAGVATAGELNPAHVPVDAKWVVHIDQEAMSELQLVTELRQLYPQMASNIRNWFKTRYGIDPQNNFRSLTMFSNDYQVHTGTVIVQTGYDEEKVRSNLEEYESLRTTEWKGHALHTITLAKHHHTRRTYAQDVANQVGYDQSSAENHTGGHDKSGGKQMTVYLGDELIVLASSVPNAKSVLRLLEGEAESLKGIESPLTAQAPEGAVIYGTAIELGRLDQYQMLLPLLIQQEQCAYALGLRDGTLFETLTLTSESEEIADKTAQVLEGWIAYEKLWAKGSKPLTKLMEDVKLSREGTESTVHWQGDSETVVSAFKDIKMRVNEWMNLASR